MKVFFPTKFDHIKNVVNTLQGTLPEKVFKFLVKNVLRAPRGLFTSDIIRDVVSSSDFEGPFNEVIEFYRMRAQKNWDKFIAKKLNQSMYQLTDRTIGFDLGDYSNLYGDNASPLIGSFKVTLDENQNKYDSDSPEYAGHLKPFKIPDHTILITKTLIGIM